MRYHLVQTGEVAYRVALGYAAHTPEYNEWYRRISRTYLTRVGLIHATPAPSYSTHSTSSSSLSSQRRKRGRTDVPGPSVSYGRVDADLIPDFAHQSSEVFNSPIPQVPYFQYGSTPASYDPGMGSGVQVEEGFSGADDIPQSEDLGDTADIPPRRNPAKEEKTTQMWYRGSFFVDQYCPKILI
ncbi:hypothetical protein O6P43_007009 [Quillaja saponaria]|uniref:Uncharacterized protein n=1 Tax=Quillaja saponaria TaxID=32244 RepID=A0AAD7Q9L5_QUISA|nr:hypothetical protein O6P43_007009 [Quillaja saponaria]